MSTEQIEFTEEQKKLIEATWIGDPPPQCTGNCYIRQASCLDIIHCTGCTWNDDECTPQT